MSQPVTTNPFIIMLINMTVVFLVLIALGLVIQFIHFVDPTKPKKEAEVSTNDAKVSNVSTATAVSAAPSVQDEGVPGEIIAVISAAIAASGTSGEIKAVRPIERLGWKQSGRIPSGRV